MPAKSGVPAGDRGGVNGGPTMAAMIRLTPVGQEARFFLSTLVRGVEPREGVGCRVDLGGSIRDFEEAQEVVLAMLRAARTTIVVAVDVDASSDQLAAIEAVNVLVSEVE